MIAGHCPCPHRAAGDALPGPDQHVQLHHVSILTISIFHIHTSRIRYSLFIAVVYLNQKVCMYLSKLTSYFYAAPFRCVFDDTKKNRRECSFDADNLY